MIPEQEEILSASSPASSFFAATGRFPRPHHLGNAAHAGGDDGQPGGGRLQKDQAQALLDLGRAHEDVPNKIGAGHLGGGG